MDSALRLGSPAAYAISGARRALDVVVATLALVLLSPVLFAVALAVRMTSPGPAVYRQERVGTGRCTFTILKFRTMTITAAAGPEITGPGDSRITRVGALLRRSALDELPQLVNILRGEMTLVGPRPETVALAERYPAECRWILDHTPGLTGPTQLNPSVARRDEGVRGSRGPTPDPETVYLTDEVPARVALDATYLASPTMAATLAVLVATARHILTGHHDLAARLPAPPSTGPENR